MAFELNLEFTSRFKKTALYSEDGKAFWGLWQPYDIRIDGDEKVYVIQLEDEGQLDLIAYREYQDRTLWPYIAFVNNIKNVEEEIIAGLRIILPKLSNIQAALRDES